MQEIRSNLQNAAERAYLSDFQGAHALYESVRIQSEAINYIGGIFCASKRLGDLYFSSGSLEYALNWYKYAYGYLSEDYLKEKLIRNAVIEMIHLIVDIASTNEQWKLENVCFYEKLEEMMSFVESVKIHEPKTNTGADVKTHVKSESYNNVIRKQEHDSKLYDSFFFNVKKDNHKIVLKQIHQGLDVNYMNPVTKFTALHNACWKGHIKTVSLLLQHGADPMIENGTNENCMQCSEIAKKEMVIELLKRVQDEGIEFLGTCKICIKEKNEQ